MRAHSRIARIAWVGIVLIFLAAAVAQPTGAATSKSRDLVVLDHERWLDTLKGTVKNFSARPARDVTIVVKFFDKKKSRLGTQRVSVGDLRSGDQSSWSLAIIEKHRSATRYEFELHAIWQ